MEGKLSERFQNDAEQALEKFFGDAQEKKKRTKEIEDIADGTKTDLLVNSGQITASVLEKLGLKGDERARQIVSGYVDNLCGIIDKIGGSNKAIGEQLKMLAKLVPYEALAEQLESLRKLLQMQFNQSMYVKMLKEKGVSEGTIKQLQEALNDQEQGKMAAAYIAEKFLTVAYDYATIVENKLLPLGDFYETLGVMMRERGFEVPIDLNFETQIDGKRLTAIVRDAIGQHISSLEENKKDLEQKVKSWEEDVGAFMSVLDDMFKDEPAYQAAMTEDRFGVGVSLIQALVKGYEENTKKYAKSLGRIYDRVKEYMQARGLKLDDSDVLKFIEAGVGQMLADYRKAMAAEATEKKTRAEQKTADKGISIPKFACFYSACRERIEQRLSRLEIAEAADLCRKNGVAVEMACFSRLMAEQQRALYNKEKDKRYKLLADKYEQLAAEFGCEADNALMDEARHKMLVFL